MSSSLKENMMKMAMSKNTWRLRLVYLLKAMVYYPFLIIEEKKKKAMSGMSSSVSTEGDDVYPLF
ncbi:hypothetical protein [Kiloniella antarctica]|uniref:Uncharacterized protein n=1 Tax=Kiloniella antarctica TaxID=1550907 RepID=A0ABW5BPS9_9PROT